jgi:hypothetical protein
METAGGVAARHDIAGGGTGVTQADGFQVDCEALEEIARNAQDIAPLGDSVLADVVDAVKNTVAGAPGFQTAAVAQQVYQEWGPWLEEEIKKIEVIARKLAETAADYCATDEGIGKDLEKVGKLDDKTQDTTPGIPGVPGGGYVPPHMDPDVVPGGGWNPPGPAGGPGVVPDDRPPGLDPDVVPGGGWNPPGPAGGPD